MADSINNKVKLALNSANSTDTANHFNPLSGAIDSDKNLQEIYSKKKEPEIKEEINDQSQSQEIKFKLYQKLFAELFGTAILLYGCCLAPVLFKDKLYVGVISSSFTVLYLVYCFVNISGAHFNPAVSLALFLNGAITLKEFFLYMIVQTIGAFIGCCCIALSRKGRFDELNATKIQDNLINVNGGTKIDIWCYISCLFTEIFCTFILNLFVLAIGEKYNKLGINVGMAFGCALIALIFSACGVSGASFNPARSLAPAVLQAISGGDTKPIEQIWIYIIGPFTGAILSYFAWKIFKI